MECYINSIGSYSITDAGVLISYHDIRNPRIMSLANDKDGYKVTVISGDGHRQNVKIHRLVAFYFVSGRTELRNQVNHKDGDKTNNNASNLEWCTSQENHIHAYKTLNRVSPMKGRRGKDNWHSRGLIQMDMEGNFIKRFDSVTEAAEELGIKGRSNISTQIQGKLNHCGGFTFRYDETEEETKAYIPNQFRKIPG